MRSRPALTPIKIRGLIRLEIGQPGERLARRFRTREQHVLERVDRSRRHVHAHHHAIHVLGRLGRDLRKCDAKHAARFENRTDLRIEQDAKFRLIVRQTDSDAVDRGFQNPCGQIACLRELDARNVGSPLAGRKTMIKSLVTSEMGFPTIGS